MTGKATLFTIATLGLAGLAGVAIAAQPMLPRAQKLFERVDQDKDGKVTLTEFSPLAQRRFLRDDANKDGQVSSAEIDEALKRAMERRRNLMLGAMDADKNGSIDKTELDSYVAAMFKGADANADGGVTLDEVKVFKFAKWRKSLQGNADN